MLSEFLQTSDPSIMVEWHQIMPGVRVCRFKMTQPASGLPLTLPVQLPHGHREALYCRSGALMLRRRQGSLLTVGGRDIMLMSDCSSILSAQIAAPLDGVLVSVDSAKAARSREMLCMLMGEMHHYLGLLGQRMNDHGGCVLLQAAPWSRSVFTTLETLSPEEQSTYCVLKTVELLYLLCTDSSMLEEETDAPSPDSYLTRTVTDMRAYMESRLDEKLTIETMSRRFHISPTAFKSCFRRLYGQPVHRWLQARRMKRAAELLQTSPMTVLQIAQAVGYDGGSQFNVAFKREFGVTPRQYKKMSESGEN